MPSCRRCWPGKGRAASWQTFRDSFATQLLEPGDDICMIQELLGYGDGRTTVNETHVLNRGLVGVRSPAVIV